MDNHPWLAASASTAAMLSVTWLTNFVVHPIHWNLIRFLDLAAVGVVLQTAALLYIYAGRRVRRSQLSGAGERDQKGSGHG